MITAPYVPTLGPVHPAAVTGTVFADVLADAGAGAGAGTGRFLPYGKAHLWGGRKDEQAILDSIIDGPEATLISTLTERTATVRSYVYGDVNTDQAIEVTRQAQALGRGS